MRIITLTALLVASHLGIVAQHADTGLNCLVPHGTTGAATLLYHAPTKPLADHTDAELVEEFSRRAASKGLSPSQRALSLECMGDGSCQFSTAQAIKPSSGSTGIYIVPAGSGTLTGPVVPSITQ